MLVVHTVVCSAGPHRGQQQHAVHSWVRAAPAYGLLQTTWPCVHILLECQLCVLHMLAQPPSITWKAVCIKQASVYVQRPLGCRPLCLPASGCLSLSHTQHKLRARVGYVSSAWLAVLHSGIIGCIALAKWWSLVEVGKTSHQCDRLISQAGDVIVHACHGVVC